MRTGPFTVPATHPAFPGHFPDNPIVPGALILGEVIRLAPPEHRIRGVAAAKFLAPLRPDMPFHIEWTLNGKGLDFVVEGADRVFVRGTLVYANGGESS